MRWCRVALLLLAAGVLAACSGGGSSEPFPAGTATGAEYIASIENWQQERLETLTAADGWLSLIALHWLEEGDTTLGTGADQGVVLPEGSAQPHAATFRYDGLTVRMIPAPGQSIAVGGSALEDIAVDGVELADDTGEPDLVGLGRLELYVVARGGRHALRIKDPEAPTRTGFAGISSYPIAEEYRFNAKFHPYVEATPIDVPTVTGTPAPMFIPGVVEFRHDGADYTLRPLVSDPADTHFFFIFRDRTSGKETYGAGRYLYGDLADGRVELDFNKAYNPPCVFTPHATCPLPPRENRFDIPIPAGEKMYAAH